MTKTRRPAEELLMNSFAITTVAMYPLWSKYHTPESREFAQGLEEYTLAGKLSKAGLDYMDRQLARSETVRAAFDAHKRYCESLAETPETNEGEAATLFNPLSPKHTRS